MPARLATGCEQEPSPPRKPREQANRLDRYLPYVIERWAQGCHTIAQIYQELLTRGFKGSYATVYTHLVRHLPAGRKHAPGGERISPVPLLARQATFLFLRRSEKLSHEEQEALLMLRQFHPEVKQAFDLVQQFVQMLHQRQGELLDAWLARVQESGIPELQSFAKGVEKDKEAVRAGLTWWINNGVVEGHVTKLKLIKRQGYGRAGFPRLAQAGPTRDLGETYSSGGCQAKIPDEMGRSPLLLVYRFSTDPS